MVIGNAKKTGVKKFLVPGTNLVTSQSAVKLAQSHPDCIHASVGFHPYETQDFPNVHNLELLLRQYNKKTIEQSNRCIVAIGECGLDYHLYKGFPAVGKKEDQKMLFRDQLVLADTYNLPVIIHCRDAFMDIFDVLDSMPTMPRGVFHCFSGVLEDFRNIRKRGLYVGIDGNVTYSKQLQYAVREIPLSRILLETDAPYLPPVPHRGQRCEPKYIPLIAKTVALCTSHTVQAVEKESTKNALALFPDFLVV